jgi:tetratricopeptide (TPR) repeat protein
MATSNRLLDAMDDANALPSLTIAQLCNIGEAALRGNHYEEAIRAFDQALGKAKVQNLRESRLVSLALLDLRVEARLRRKKYDRARKDAETMIRVDKTDARGYIRLGQIKRLQGDRSAALKSYSTGLEYVLTNRPLRDVLKTKHENALRAITQLKPTDPVTVLPAELLRMILYHFDYREATAIIRVSKSWRDAIVSLPLIRTALTIHLGIVRSRVWHSKAACVGFWSLHQS